MDGELVIVGIIFGGQQTIWRMTELCKGNLFV